MVVVGVKGSPVFEDTVDQVNEFAHDGNDDDHFGFAAGFQASSESLNERVAAHGSDGRPVEDSANAGFAHFGDTGTAPDRIARLMVGRSHPHIGGGRVG